MRTYKETRLRDFEFWGNAKFVRSLLKVEELDQFENVIELGYPDGISETELNDIFAYDSDVIAEYVGYKDFAALVEDRADGKYE